MPVIYCTQTAQARITFLNLSIGFQLSSKAVQQLRPWASNLRVFEKKLCVVKVSRQREQHIATQH